MKKKLLLFAAILFISFQLSAQTTGNPGLKQHRVVLQLSSNDTLVWKGLMNNIRNMKNGWGDSVTIEVVAHGPGIEFLMLGKTTQQKRIFILNKKGVEFGGFEIKLEERRCPKEKCTPETGFVKMGVGEIILKQEQGWSYIKVGF